jgi:hypothetical protein
VKGEGMDILLTLVATIIIYPIIFILPFGMKAKQKLLLLTISLLISTMGILSLNIIPFWQSLIMMVALAGLATIILRNRLKEQKEHNHVIKVERKVVDYASNKSIQPVTIIENIVGKTEESKENVQDIVDSNVIVIPLITQAQELEEITFEPDLLEDEMQLETLFEEIHANKYVAASIELDDDMEEIEFLKEFEPFEELDKFDETDDQIEIEDNTPIEPTHYLSEIERLLQEDEMDSLIELEERNIEDKKVEGDSVTPQLKEFKLEKLY